MRSVHYYEIPIFAYHLCVIRYNQKMSGHGIMPTMLSREPQYRLYLSWNLIALIPAQSLRTTKILIPWSSRRSQSSACQKTNKTEISIKTYTALCFQCSLLSQIPSTPIEKAVIASSMAHMLAQLVCPLFRYLAQESLITSLIQTPIPSMSGLATIRILAQRPRSKSKTKS